MLMNVVLRSCGLACLSFFWPFAILESVALDRELRGELRWDRVLQLAVLCLQFTGASLLTLVSVLASFSRCYLTFQCLWLELCWAALALAGFILVHSKIEEELSPARGVWYVCLLMNVPGTVANKATGCSPFTLDCFVEACYF